MTVFEFQEKYQSLEKKKEALSKMTEKEVRAIIDSCGTPQGKSFIKDLYAQSQQGFIVAAKRGTAPKIG